MEEQANYLAKRPQAGGVMEGIESQRAMQEVQGMMFLARTYPRQLVDVIEGINKAFSDPEFCETCLYSYPRGGTEISDLSIRAAETLAQVMGNVHHGVRELERVAGSSVVESYAWDLETNNRSSKVFSVEHSRSTRRGTIKLEDNRDIYEMVANNASRRQRACMLAVMPRGLVDRAKSVIEKTLLASAEVTPERLAGVEKQFKKLGVNKAALEKFLGRSLESIKPVHLVGLRKINTSIVDGMSSPGDWFDVSAEKAAAATLAERLKQKKGKAAPPKEEPQQEQAATTSGEAQPPTEPPEPPASDLTEKTLAQLAEIETSFDAEFKQALGNLKLPKINTEEEAKALFVEINRIMDAAEG